MHDPAKRQAERERHAARYAERKARPPETSCLQTDAAEPAQPKPRGRAPLAEGKPCTWNGEDGFWVMANGCRLDVAAARKASKAEDFQHLKRIDKEEQKQRRSLCARIAAAVEASGRPAPSASRRLRRPSERCGRIVLTPAPLFWAKAEALVAQEEFLTWRQSQVALPKAAQVAAVPGRVTCTTNVRRRVRQCSASHDTTLNYCDSPTCTQRSRRDAGSDL